MVCVSDSNYVRARQGGPEAVGLAAAATSSRARWDLKKGDAPSTQGNYRIVPNQTLPVFSTMFPVEL